MILLVNDDGIEAPGLRALYRALRQRCQESVLVVAPQEACSGAGHAITLQRSLSITPVQDADFFGFAVDGQPCDCVKLALRVIAQSKPRLVLSGINAGPNVGRSLFYSGTLAAAMEAAIEGHAGIAISQDHGDGDWQEAAHFSAELVAHYLRGKAFKGQVLNLNLPGRPAANWRSLRWCQHGLGGFDEGYQAQRDQNGQVRWQLQGDFVVPDDEKDQDCGLLQQGHPTLSLLSPQYNADQPIPEQLLPPAERAWQNWRQEALA